MSVHLDKARRLAAAGKYKAAVDSLYYAEPGARAGDLIELRGILDVIATVREHADGRIQKNCDEIKKAMQDVLDRESGPAVEIMKQSFASLSGCRVIGGAGLPVQPDANRLWRLCFTDDRVVLFPDYRPQPDEFFDIGWSGLGIEIEGAGAIRRGGGFMGGGFGVEGAAVGMLAASALNALTTTTQIDTVVHVQTHAVELYLFYDRETPVVLRRTLSSVFLRLRQSAAADEPSRPASDDGHVVDRLHKLADLLDRGLIDEAEFARLKADLMGQVP
jgi:hypothetical protein